jgi:polysaccharide export outer membrane protein
MMMIQESSPSRLAAWALMGALLAPGVLWGADADTTAASQDHGTTSLPFPLTSVVGDDYRLQPLDLVVFEMLDEPDLETQQRISTKGDLRLPMLGSVLLLGLSVRSAEEQLESLYRVHGYYKHPQVTLYVAQHTERMISVIGQVNRPDRIELPIGTDEMGLAQVVAVTGGLTRIAKANAIQVSRIGPDGKEQRFVVNFETYLNAQKTGAVSDFRLQPGDVVFVPERSI